MKQFSSNFNIFYLKNDFHFVYFHSFKCVSCDSEEIDNIIKTMSSTDYRRTVFASATGKSPNVEEAAAKHMKVNDNK